MVEIPKHGGIARRLGRANGHLARIIEIIEKGESCISFAQQLKAVESAVTKVKQLLIHKHINSYLEAASRVWIQSKPLRSLKKSRSIYSLC